MFAYMGPRGGRSASLKCLKRSWLIFASCPAVDTNRIIQSTKSAPRSDRRSAKLTLINFLTRPVESNENSTNNPTRIMRYHVEHIFELV